MITYAIVDDEPIAHRIIEGYCAELPHLKKVGNAYNAFEASQIISQKKVDLVFLDINMPKMTGFEWLKTLPKIPEIIVTSAYKEYALEGYELDVLDYLLKPFSLSRFLQAVNKVSSAKEDTTTKSAKGRKECNYFFLKGDKQHHQILIKDILFIEAYGNYVKVFFGSEMVISHEKISTLETRLAEDNFLRVHKSFPVAVDKIKLIQGNQIFLKDHKIPIGQTYRAGINRLLGGN